MNTDERRAKTIVEETLNTIPLIPDFDKVFQKFLNSDYREGLGNQKPHALAVSFAIWLKGQTKQ
jgi:hypothetical protein